MKRLSKLKFVFPNYNNKNLIRAVCLVFVLVGSIVAFQNFEIRNREVVLYPNRSLSGHTSDSATLCKPQDIWVVDLEIDNLYAGDSVIGSINLFDGRGEIPIDTLRLPSSIGSCSALPSQNKLRVCIQKAPNYEFELKLKSLSGKAVNYRGPAVKGCESRPGLIQTGAF